MPERIVFKSLFCILLVFVNEAVNALEIETRTSIETSLAMNINDKKSQSNTVIVRPEITADLDNGGRLTAIGRFLAERISGVRPGDVDFDAYSPSSKPLKFNDEVEFELREFYFETAVNDDYMIVGKQQVVWGKADGLKVLDVINPQSFRNFILDDFEESRIPLWMFNYEWQIDSHSTLQVLWIPDQTVHVLPNSGATYAFTTPRLVPSAPPGVVVDINALDRPSRIIEDCDIGLRWSAFVAGWDLTLNYFYHYDDFPVLRQNLVFTPTGVKVAISPEYERSHLLGGTFSNAFGSLTVRGEVGYSSNRFFLTRNPDVTGGVVESDEVSYVVGLDWFGFDETLLSVQFFQSVVLDPPSGLTRPVVDNTLTFLAQKLYFNDTLKTEVLTIHNMYDNDGLVRPKVTYELEDDIKIWFGADVFYGSYQGLFGQYDSNDRIYLGIEMLI